MPLRVQRAAVLAAIAGTAAAFFQTTAQAQSVQRGVVIARTYCMNCHSIDKVSPSPIREAPPFRDLHKRYPVEGLQESLAEGIVTGHPSMPEFRFDPDQIGDFIAYLKSLR
jgi:mono/diheme cytochrome c family protein